MQRRQLIKGLAAGAIVSTLLPAFAAEPVTLKVGASPLVTGDILEFVKPALAKKVINLKIIEFTDYIQQNLSRGDISLDEIAEHLMISKSYLCRLFQKKRGVSVRHYIHNIRIEKAKEYLNDFRLKIYEIAELTGFNSSTHFNIVFKKIMQCTPVEYRNGLKQ